MMDFPSYVPTGARNHALHFLGYYEPYKEECEVELAEIKEHLAYWQRPNHHPNYAEIQIAELRQRKAEVIKRRDTFARDIANIRRLVLDTRMKNTYQILTNVFFDNEEQERQRKFDGFIYAAWSARLDFSPFRERLQRAAELRDEIARTADKLARLLDDIGETGVICPGEFFCIPELLRTTDNHEMNNHNLHMWRAMRGHVLGDPPRRDPSKNEQAEFDPADKLEIVFRILEPGEKPDIDPAEQARNTLRYGWENSPPLSELLKTVSQAAREFNPSEGGLIGAAISSKKRNEKTEYLRAFGNLLIEQHRFNLTSQIMKAMVIAANVVINSPDIDVTYDDVRKALAKLGGDPLEDSVQK